MKCQDCRVDWHVPNLEVTEVNCGVGVCTKMKFHCCNCHQCLKTRYVHNRECRNKREGNDND
jgi:hypothetical protein